MTGPGRHLVGGIALLLAVGAQAQLPAGKAPVAATPAAAAKSGAAKAEDTDPRNQPTLTDDKDVIEASEKWLGLIDAARYGTAYDLGGKGLKSAAKRKEFVDGMAGMRKPFGKLVMRKPAQFARAHSMPGGPDGDYALVSFDTRFVNGKSAQEQVIWFLEPDAVWRVTGYFIR
jgi:hypothetical protein